MRRIVSSPASSSRSLSICGVSAATFIRKLTSGLRSVARSQTGLTDEYDAGDNWAATGDDDDWAAPGDDDDIGQRSGDDR